MKATCFEYWRMTFEQLSMERGSVVELSSLVFGRSVGRHNLGNTALSLTVTQQTVALNKEWYVQGNSVKGVRGVVKLM